MIIRLSILMMDKWTPTIVMIEDVYYLPQFLVHYVVLYLFIWSFSHYAMLMWEIRKHLVPHQHPYFFCDVI